VLVLLLGARCSVLGAWCLVLGYKLRKCIVGIAQERKKI
jgi:hypothetical protein